MYSEFTITNYAERELLAKRLKILNDKWDRLGDQEQLEFPDIDFTLRDFQDIIATANTLVNIRSVYGDK
jgi:hypothetical protein